MIVVGWLALVFLTLAGYSAGAVLGSWTRSGVKRTSPSPGLLDTALVALLWIGGAGLRLSGVETWRVVGPCLVLALVIAFTLGRVRSQPQRDRLLTQ